VLAQHKYNKVLERKSKWHVEPSKLIENSYLYQELLQDLKYVYFLIDNGIIVYVGKSDSIQSRLHQHTRDKEFDRIAWIQVNSHEQKYIEAYYIMTLKPKYNKFLPVRVRR